MLGHPEISVLGCATTLFAEERIRRGMRVYIEWQNSCCSPEQTADEIYIESPFAHPSVVFRRQTVLELGGYRNGAFPEDYELWLRLHHAGKRLAKLPHKLLDWRDTPTRISRTDPRCSRQAFDRLRADYLSRDPRLLAHSTNFAIWGAGRKTRKRCRLLLERGFTPRTWIDIDPRKIGNRLSGVPVVSPTWLTRSGNRCYVLVYVTNHGARETIAADLLAMGYQRGLNYLMVG